MANTGDKDAMDRRWSGVSGMNQVRDARMIITHAGLAQLKAYKYQSSAYTPLDTLLNQYWWTPVSEYLPMWIAPNLVTLLGLIIVVLGFFTLTFFVPKLEGEAPSWAYFSFALCVFLYQTLDAIDGKQARRTGSSSPLGQLFDHGCDSVSTTFIMLGTAAAFNCGPSSAALVLLFGVQIPFFLAQWQEYHTHIMSTAVGFIGVTEGHWGAIAVCCLTGTFGTYVWDLHIGPFTLRQITLGVMVGGTGLMAFNNIWTVFGKTERKVQAVVQLVPLIALTTFGFLWSTDTAEDSIFKTHPRLTAGTLGMLFTHLSNQMILCGMTHMAYPTWQWILLPLPIIFTNSYFKISPRHDEVILGVYLGVSLVLCYVYVRDVIEEICNSLGIYCLKLGPRQKQH